MDTGDTQGGKMEGDKLMVSSQSFGLFLFDFHGNGMVNGMGKSIIAERFLSSECRQIPSHVCVHMVSRGIFSKVCFVLVFFGGEEEI